MKKIFGLIFLSLSFTFQVRAQSIINSADLPHANDTFRVSIGQIDQSLDLSSTGPAAMWDFSQLVHTSQRVDTFIDESATNPIFSIIFIDNAFNNNRANQATASAGFSLGTFISLTDIFNFYYNSSASYKQVGLGATVNGIPLPITYSPHDIIYKFPLQFPSVDSANSGYAIDLTSTLGLYYKVNKTRKNEVDGWGNLTTPFGTFDVLRVHSTVVQQDSIYIDSLTLGLNFPAVTTHEYKWLGNGQGIPLLQINTTGNGMITQIIYKDSVHSVIGITKVDPFDLFVEVFPNPAVKNATLNYKLDNPAMVSVGILSALGESFIFMEEKLQNEGLHSIQIDLGNKSLSPGNYFVKMVVNERTYLRPLIISSVN
ncbi:MAG TPA: T9SS type A sorting domain-containing protein [Bacteroidia bacterium]|nr:T9SS type A sorting domain-containing protein [Bacteroidia bacterium]